VLVSVHYFSLSVLKCVLIPLAAASVAFGVVAGTICNFATKLKFTFGYDDCLDIFASHAVGGVVGNLLTGIFAQASVANLDGITPINGGWINHNWIQLGYQLADSMRWHELLLCRHHHHPLGYALYPWPPPPCF
jgi:ammonia channel protein AmtB